MPGKNFCVRRNAIDMTFTLENKDNCYICGLESTWNNLPLKMKIHKLDNGIKVSICPNCFSQLGYKKKIHKPDIYVLQKETAIIGIDGVARRYATDEDTVRKWLID